MNSVRLINFLLMKGKKVVGRVAAIINHRANETWKKKEVRFGWIDFLDKPEISRSIAWSSRRMGEKNEEWKLLSDR